MSCTYAICQHPGVLAFLTAIAVSGFALGLSLLGEQISAHQPERRRSSRRSHRH